MNSKKDRNGQSRRSEEHVEYEVAVDELRRDNEYYFPRAKVTFAALLLDNMRHIQEDMA